MDKVANCHKILNELLNNNEPLKDNVIEEIVKDELQYTLSGLLLCEKYEFYNIDKGLDLLFIGMIFTGFDDYENHLKNQVKKGNNTSALYIGILFLTIGYPNEYCEYKKSFLKGIKYLKIARDTGNELANNILSDLEIFENKQLDYIVNKNSYYFLNHINLPLNKKITLERISLYWFDIILFTKLNYMSESQIRQLANNRLLFGLFENSTIYFNFINENANERIFEFSKTLILNKKESDIYIIKSEGLTFLKKQEFEPAIQLTKNQLFK